LYKNEEDNEAVRIKQKQADKIKRGRQSKYIKQIHKEDDSLDEFEEVGVTAKEPVPEYDFGGALQTMTVEEI